MKKAKLTYIIIILILFYLLIFSDIGIISRIQLQKRINKNQAKINLLEKQNERLRLQIEQLKSDRVYLAALARKFGYAKPGEKIYKFYEPSQSTNEQSANVKLNWLEKIPYNNYYLYIILMIVCLFAVWIYFKKRI